jgi:uncharacterized membrane protein
MASGRNRPAKTGGTATRSRSGAGGGKPTGSGGKATTGGRGKAAASGKDLAKRTAATVSRQPPRSEPQTRRARDRARAKELAQQQTEDEPVQIGPPSWLQLTSLILAIGGLGVSIYLTIEHFTGNKSLACAANSVVNCEAVTSSSQSMVFGVFPVAVLGLAFFVFAVPIMTPMAWRSRRREIAWARLASVITGVGFILYLIYAEIYQIGFICLWCTSVHVITFLLFVLVALSAAIWGLHPEDADGRAR